MNTVLVPTRRPALRHGTLVTGTQATITLQPRRLRAREPRPSLTATRAPSPLPDLLVQRQGGVTFIDTANGDADCNLADIVRPANTHQTTTLTVAIARTDLISALLDENLEPRLDAVIEVAVGEDLLPRFVVAAVRLGENGESVVFDLADRRFELAARFVGRTGPPPNLTATFFGSGTPTGWTQNPAAGVSVAELPAGVPGVHGPTDGGAMAISADGTAPSWISATFTPTAVPYDRTVAFGSFFKLPLGGWHPNDATLLMTISTVVDATDEDIDTDTLDLNNETDYTADAWFAASVAASIPKDVVARVEARLYYQHGTIYVEDPNTYEQESLFWVDTDAGKILRDLIAHASDTTNWGHSDTKVRATTTSVPDTGVVVTRVIDSQEKQQVSSAITDLSTVGGVWQNLTPQDDGTDLFTADEAGLVTPVVAEDSNAKLEPWQWQGGAGVLGMFAPDTTDFTGQRLIAWQSPAGAVLGRGLPYDLGREQYTVGPYGNYDARLVESLVRPFFLARDAALVSSVTLGFDADTITEWVTGDLRPGCFLDCRVGAWPNGLTGRYRITSTTLHLPAWTVSVELNRETVGSDVTETVRTLAGYAGGYGGGY